MRMRMKTRQLKEKRLRAWRGAVVIHTGRANPYWFTARDSSSCGKLGHWWGHLKHEDYKAIVHSCESRTKSFFAQICLFTYSIEPEDCTQSRESLHAPKLTEALLCSCVCIWHGYEPLKKQRLAKLRWTWNPEQRAFLQKKEKWAVTQEKKKLLTAQKIHIIKYKTKYFKKHKFFYSNTIQQTTAVDKVS